MMTITTSNTWVKRLAAGAVLTAGSALFALGAAAISQADTTGPNISQPTPHHAFPSQDLSPDKPGSPAHHHHQWHHAG